MNPHFFTAPFYFAFIWFRVQGSRFRALVAASPPFFRRWYSRIVSLPLEGKVPRRGNAIKLRKSLATQRLASPFGGSAEGNRGMTAV